MPPLQSGFRKFHSMESLMVSLLADIFHDVDRSHIILLSLYDISAAFDTVDHTILLDLLSRSFGIVNSASLLFFGSIHALPSWPCRHSRCSG